MENENRKSDSGVGEEKREAGGRAATATADRNTSATTARARATTATARATATGTVKAEKVPEISTVKPQPKAVEVTPPDPKATKRTRKRAVKKDDTNSEMAAQLSAMLVAISNVAATRPDLKHWAISDKEAMTIAEPLTKMIEKSEALKKVAEHSDGLALAVACTTVFMPRAMITFEITKQKRALKNKGVKVNDTKTGTNNTDSGKNNRGNAADNKSSSQSILSVLSDTAF